jgi:hypothetical protein
MGVLKNIEYTTFTILVILVLLAILIIVAEMVVKRAISAFRRIKAMIEDEDAPYNN